MKKKSLSFKASEEEAAYIRRQAKREYLSVSAYLRRQALGQMAEGSLGKVRCEFTGAEIFVPLPGSEPLITETVREMISGFP